MSSEGKPPCNLQCTLHSHQLHTLFSWWFPGGKEAGESEVIQVQLRPYYVLVALPTKGKGGVECPAGPEIAVPLFLAVRNAGALFHCILEPRPFIILCMVNLDRIL